MRATIYVPDNLWDRVKEAFPTRNTSELAQAGFEELLRDRGTPEFARERPPADPERLERARAKLLEQAREWYEIGYREGMKRAEYLEWWMLDRLATMGWDVKRWLRTTSTEATDSEGKVFAVPIEVSYGLEELALDNTSLGLGFVHALRDVWESVVKATDEDRLQPMERE